MDKGFNTLELSQEMILNLQKHAYKEMTPIQSIVLPYMLQGSDVIAQAKTGSGKTAAFGIGLLEKLRVKNFYVQTLILTPTRELAEQVAKELRVLAKFAHNIKILTLCGGTAFGPQLGSLRHGAHIVVGTPGRVLKHLKKETLSVEKVETLVLDEADRMLDMGFIEEVEEIIKFVPKQRQTLLFSATYSEDILEVSNKIQKSAIELKALSKEVQNDIDEVFYHTQEDEKIETLVNLFSHYEPKNAIVFTSTKLAAQDIAHKLVEKKIDALAIHGDLEQYERRDVLVQFSNESCPVLVATDVAARGLDIKELAMVVNFDMPSTPEVYTHRIGRTGRAGAKGLALSLFEDTAIKEEYENSKRVFQESSSLKKDNFFEMKPLNLTVVIEGGKKEKLRPGDILGALTGKHIGLDGSSIGKIDVYDRQSYVAISSDAIKSVQKKLSHATIKNKKFSTWIL
jgi:ATP-independent RNA helicase DbpA